MQDNDSRISDQKAVTARELTADAGSDSQEPADRMNQASLLAIQEMQRSISQMSGRLRYTLTNDYLFRAVFQTNQKVLKGLLASVLHLEPEDIQKLVILNPILLGQTMNEKTCILDLYLLMNDHTRINIEMQVAPKSYYRDRTLLYTGRAYDSLERGAEYGLLRPVVHISLLAEPPRTGKKKFYSEWMMLDIEDHEIFSRNFRIIVVQLKENKQAKEREINSGLARWARLFLAETWEELQEIIKESDWMAETVYTLRNLTEDEKIRLECEARERYEHEQASLYGSGLREGRLEEQKNTELERRRAEIAEAELARLHAILKAHDIPVDEANFFN